MITHLVKVLIIRSMINDCFGNFSISGLQYLLKGLIFAL